MSRKVARPYARALFEVLKPEGGEAIAAANAALARAAAAFAELPELVRAFELPVLSQRQKADLLAELSQALALPAKVERLLVALQLHYRLRYLAAVAEEFSLLCDRFAGVLRGKVMVPAPLRPEQVTALEQALARVVGAKVALSQEERPELLAGFVVRLGSLVFDGSLQRQLELFAAKNMPGGGRYAG
ncbi:MAG: ATP synthase F1 subunit delta [Thermoanaerobaculum sp.]